MSTTYSPLYPAATAAYTISPENVASSATFTGGVQSDANDNLTNLDADINVTGKWTTNGGTNSTANTAVQTFVVVPMSDDKAGTLIWPDTITGAGAAAKTVTSASILSTLGALVGICNIGDVNQGRTYWSRPFSIVQALGLLVMPTNHVLFVTQNSGQNSHSTSSNHAWWKTRMRWQGV